MITTSMIITAAISFIVGFFWREIIKSFTAQPIEPLIKKAISAYAEREKEEFITEVYLRVLSRINESCNSETNRV